MVSAPEPELQSQGVSGVKEVVLENFKSYEGQVRVGPFKKFTCVVGPNGAGKSNLMDAISFVLGVRTRHLRSDRLQELVHRHEQEAVSDVSGKRCSVELVYLDESGDRPREKTFRRVIQPAAEARFQIDGEPVSQEVYLSSLEEINVLSKARNFLVFQGDVEAAAQRQGKELTNFLEQVSGSIALRAEYEKLAADKAQREDVARDLYTRKRNALSEKKRMSQQKEEAERYRNMDTERKQLQAEFVLFRVCCAETKVQEIATNIQNLRAEVDEAQVQRKEAEQQVVEAEQQRAQVQLAVSNAEKGLQSTKGHLQQLSPDQLQARSELQALQRRQQEASHHKELDAERERQLTQEADELKLRVKQLEEELETLRAQRPEMPFSEQQWQQFRKAQEEAERLTSGQSQEVKDLEQRLKAKRKQRAIAEMDRREADLRVRHLKQKVEGLQPSVELKREARASRENELDVLATELQGMAEGHQSRSSARKKLEDERKLMEEIQQITATEQQIERERRLKQVCQDLAQVIPGVSGRVVNLCQPVQKKYRVAVNVALGNYMDAVVTDSIQHARQCVQHLKERMMEPLTFLPMDNLRRAPEDRLKEALRGQKSLRPALSCISHEPHLNRAFQFMLSDVVVADTLEDGRRFVFEHLKDVGIKCRVVTLNGETISRDGNLAVSSEARQGSTRFDFSELETTKRRLEVIDSELMDMRSKHSRENAAYAAVEDAKKQAELVVRDAARECQRAEAELQSRQKELSAAEQQLSEVATEDPEEETLQAELKELEQRIGVATANLFLALDTQLGADVRSMERELRRKREALQFQEDAVLRQQAALKAELAMLELTLEECRSRSRGTIEDEATVQALRQRHEELEQQLAAVKEQVDSEAEALQKQGELLKSQEQAVAAARRDLKEKQREAAEGERRLSVLGSELKEAREARLQLLCQSLLEDVDLPFLGSKKECKAALRRVVSAGSESSGHELSIDVQLDYQQLPEERRAAAGSGPASKLLEDEYRKELRRLGGQLEQVQPNLKAIDQLEEADQEAMAAEREVQKAKKKMEAVERSFEELRCQRREKFMQCFHQVQEEIQEVYRRLTKGAAVGLEGGSAFLDLEDLEDPWNGGIKFTAMPPSKRFSDMALLSGGEKTVAAMSLLFAIQAYQRPPFLVLDEIDAHLDHSNVLALAKFIDSIGCQAIVISQKDRFFSHGEGLVGISKHRDTSVVFTMDLTRMRPARAVGKLDERHIPMEAVPLQ